MMKNKLLSFSLLAAATALLPAGRAAADLDLPRPSPFAKVSQDVGLTTITVDYSAPGVKGRKIWGSLVPYGQMWRTGANVATKVTFSKDVTFAGKPVPAGSYALFTIPTAGEWTVILNKKAEQPGTATGYKAEDDLLRVTLRPKTAPFRERLAFLVTDFTDDKASLELEWEKVRLAIPVEVGTSKQALANIAATLDNTWRPYANAARYLLDNKKDLDTALKYVDQSIALKEDWYNVWIKASLLAAKGNYKEAYPLAQKASDLGTKQGNFFLEADVKKALSDWKKKS
jgi:tetratricopeptide (TPR) repeat protein